MTITDFLLARVAEDEETARFCLDHRFYKNDEPASELPIACHDGSDHVALAPARVLAECQARRTIVELHAAYDVPQVMVYGTIVACETCGSVDDSPVEWPCDTLRALAAVYADHANYDESWAPEVPTSTPA